MNIPIWTLWRFEIWVISLNFHLKPNLFRRIFSFCSTNSPSFKFAENIWFLKRSKLQLITLKFRKDMKEKQTLLWNFTKKGAAKKKQAWKWIQSYNASQVNRFRLQFCQLISEISSLFCLARISFNNKIITSYQNQYKSIYF